MSSELISRSPDLKRLRDEGYEVEVRGGYLVVGHMPYLNSTGEIKFGSLVSALTMTGDITSRPNDHVVQFAGEFPCNKDGSTMDKIRCGGGGQMIAPDLVTNHSFSSKPPEGYPDYHAKMTTYASIISGPAESLDPSVTAKTFAVIESHDEESVFEYVDTASSRADIVLLAKRLGVGRIAIVGLGGTGSYILDFLAKTPIKEIHLFDGDAFYQHNAFRSPGAASVEELRDRPSKVSYLKSKYSKMHRNIVVHESYVSAANVDELCGMDFVFLALDSCAARRLVVTTLLRLGIAFIDVGMGVEHVDSKLHGIVRTTTCTMSDQDLEALSDRIPYSDGDANGIYSQNIQLAELNALNASLAVIKWKKLAGFYADLDQEHHSLYTIDGNHLDNVGFR